ncbi:MAG: glycosyltransferase [Nanoarchaeota archaeon]|nr:glycosyltransferase [Nanoarchaeota archaeon]
MIFTFLDVVLFVTYFLLLFLSIFWLLVLFSPEEKKKEVKITGKFPLFSVIVPAHNEQRSIEATLQSLVDLDYPKDKIEIIVVPNACTDRTTEIVEQFIARHPSQKITIVTQEVPSKGKAMNNGLAVAKGEFFACLDADSFVSSNALQVMLPLFEDENIAAVCPMIKVKNPKSVLEKVQWYEYIINMFHRFLNAKLNCLHVTPGPFSVYRTEVIRKIGGFDEQTITEDLEIAVRLQKHQYRILHTFDVIVETIAPSSWKALFRQRVRWYKGATDNTIRYKEMIFNKKYGDFGYLRMPTIILSGILAIVLVGTFLQAITKKAYFTFFYLKDINFDLLTLLKHFSINPNLLALPFSRLFVAFTLMAFSFFVMIYSYKLIKERITNHGRTLLSLITYLLIYGFFMTAVWMYIGFMFVRKKKNFWN